METACSKSFVVNFKSHRVFRCSGSILRAPLLGWEVVRYSRILVNIEWVFVKVSDCVKSSDHFAEWGLSRSRSVKEAWSCFEGLRV